MKSGRAACTALARSKVSRDQAGAPGVNASLLDNIGKFGRHLDDIDAVSL